MGIWKQNKWFCLAMLLLATAAVIFSQTYTGANQYTSAINNGVTMGEKGARWVTPQDSQPAVSVQATTSKAAGGGTVRHVADCVSFSAMATTAPAAAAQIQINLRDGATGAGTVLWSQQIFIPATVGQSVAPFQICGLNKIGSANTAMTLEYSALVTNLFESVDLTGFDVQ